MTAKRFTDLRVWHSLNLYELNCLTAVYGLLATVYRRMGCCKQSFLLEGSYGLGAQFHGDFFAINNNSLSL